MRLGNVRSEHMAAVIRCTIYWPVVVVVLDEEVDEAWPTMTTKFVSPVTVTGGVSVVTLVL